ncbi:hypothetical protein [Kingella kingae]|nr:hypothetical protein [Kingella kingae]
MTGNKLKDSNPIETHIAQLKIWQRDCKKFQQTDALRFIELQPLF